MYHRAMDALRRTFVGAALAWAALLPLATFAASRAHVSAAVSGVALAVYAVGAVVCHQLPARSFHLWGAQMPVCARCTGIYFGAAVAPAIAWVRVKARRMTTRTSAPFAAATKPRAGTHRSVIHAVFDRPVPQALAALAIAPAAATLVYEWTTGITPSNAVRFASGLWLGAILAALVVHATTQAGREVN